jgi:hypothetical protein
MRFRNFYQFFFVTVTTQTPNEEQNGGNGAICDYDLGILNGKLMKVAFTHLSLVSFDDVRAS